MKRQQITMTQIVKSLQAINAVDLLNDSVKVQIEYIPRTAEIKLFTVRTKKIHAGNGNMEEQEKRKNENNYKKL